MSTETTNNTAQQAVQVQQDLIGRCDHRLDPKRRVTIPQKWFERMNSPADLLVMRSLTGDPCLSVFTYEDFNARMAPLRNRAFSDARLAAFLREVSENVVSISVDSQNRLRLPEDMLEYIGLAGSSNDVVLIGTGTRFEVWSLASRPKQALNEKTHQRSFAELAQDFNF